MKNYNVVDIKNLVNSAKTALVVVPVLSVDGIAGGLALAVALRKKGIDTKVYCPQKTDNNYSKLSGLELLTETVTTSDLVVSLDYPLDQIEKVSYNDNGGHLNLVVQTKPGSTRIQNDNIRIQNQSGAADLCFMLGDETPLADSASLVNRGNWVLITPAEVIKAWAKASLVDPDAPFCEIFTFLIPMLGMELDMDSGKNLLIGLRVATQSFAVNVSPETFEAGAINLRATQPPLDSQPAPQPAPTPSAFDNVTPIEQVESKPGTNKPNPTPTI